MNKFNVIIYDFNHKRIEPYNIIPYFIDEYKECQKFSKKYKNEEYYKVPVSHEEFVKFITDRSRQRFWSRCEYEFIISSWPPSHDGSGDQKIDIHYQIMMNVDLIANMVKQEVNNK